MVVMRPARMGSASRPFLIAAALALLTAVIFSGAVRNDFVNYDDDLYVYANPVVARGLSLDGVVAAFTMPQARNWHPLTTISHMVDCAIFGPSPTGPHAINVLLHALTVGGLFLVLTRATGSVVRAAFVSLLFAIHPLRVESVAWISERKDVLSALLFVVTIGLYLRYVENPAARRMFWVALTYGLALMAKPMVVTLPFVLLLLDYWPLRRCGATQSTWGRLISEKAPLFVLAACSCGLTLWAASYGGASTENPLPMTERLSGLLAAPWRYLALLFWPSQLAPLYPYERIDGVTGLMAGAALTLLSGFFFVLRRRYPEALVGWLWFLGMLVPVSGLISIGLHSHADRYTYLPSIGVLLALVWGVSRFFSRGGSVLAGLGLIVAGLLGWLTWTQLQIWRNSETVWKHTLAVTRNNSVAANNLGAYYESRGDVDGALAQYQNALVVVDRQPAARASLQRASIETNIGNVKASQSDLAGAIEEYRRAIRTRPDFANAHVNLARVFAQQRDWSAALTENEIALQLQPRDAATLHQAGVALVRLGRTSEASGRFRRAWELDPKLAIAGVDLGNMLLGEGKIDEALLWYRRAAEADPKNADAKFNLGSIYLQQGRPADAATAYEEAIAIAPNDAEAHLGLANAFAAGGADKRAMEEGEKALALAPESVSALNNLAWLLAATADPALRQPERAVGLAEKAERLAPEPNAVVYHTLAAAYASAGRHDDAVNAAEKSRGLAESAGDTKLAEAVTKQLATLQK